jgi:hypothetical protein
MVLHVKKESERTGRESQGVVSSTIVRVSRERVGKAEEKYEKFQVQIVCVQT